MQTPLDLRPGSHRGARPVIALVIAVVLALGSGCADDAPAADSGAEPEAVNTTAGQLPADSSEPVVRTVSHAAGETEVPANPERIVVLDAGTTLPTLLDLGVPVVGAPLPAGDYPTDLFPDGAVDGIESIGFPEPSLEAVRAVAPDLIVGLDFPELLDAYDELSQLAPTVLVEGTLSDWKVQARALADAAGRAEAFDEQLADYQADVAALAEELGIPSEIEVSVIRSLGDQFRIHTRFHFAGQVIDEVGLSRPVPQRTDDPDVRFFQHSFEQLALADADVIYLYARGSVGSAGSGLDEDLADLRSTGIWDNLGAVQSKAVHVVDPLAWQQGGLPAAELILADLRDTLTG